MGSGSICAKIVDWDESIPNKYVVVFSRYEGKLLLSRHRDRDTWETQGGHIEPGESPEDAAKRELWEESGAVDFTLEPLCMYWAEDRVDGKLTEVFRTEFPAGSDGYFIERTKWEDLDYHGETD